MFCLSPEIWPKLCYDSVRVSVCVCGYNIDKKTLRSQVNMLRNFKEAKSLSKMQLQPKSIKVFGEYGLVIEQSQKGS